MKLLLFQVELTTLIDRKSAPFILLSVVYSTIFKTFRNKILTLSAPIICNNLMEIGVSMQIVFTKIGNCYAKYNFSPKSSV